MSGIVGYGAFLPYARIKVEEIQKVWRNIPLERVQNVLKVKERAVLQPNEDTITLAIASAREAISNAHIDREEIGALFLGTGTNPYDSKPSSTVIAEAIGTSSNLMCGDIQFSGKSGSTAIQVCAGLVDSGMVRVGLAIGSDTINRHTCPGRVYEYTASAGAAAFLIGTENTIANIMGTRSWVTDFSDFFRVEGDRYIQSTGEGAELYPAWEVGFVDHVSHAARSLMEDLNLKPEDYRFAVFQQPYGFVPFSLGERLGFKKEQVDPGVIAMDIGDCGAASALLGLIHVLDRARSGDRILVASYGFGAGSDAISIEATQLIEEKRPGVPLAKMLKEKMLVDYATACRLEYKYAQDLSPLYV